MTKSNNKPPLPEELKKYHVNYFCGKCNEWTLTALMHREHITSLYPVETPQNL